MVPYGPPIQAAVAKGDLAEMKRLAAQTESYLAQSGDVSAALEILRGEIAKLEQKKK
jgi:uncharacterized protein DUF1843